MLSFYLNSTLMAIVITIALAMILAYMTQRGTDNKDLGDIQECLYNLSHKNFIMPENMDIPEEIRGEIESLLIELKSNLKTQIKLSTELFFVCENLNILSQDNLSSIETITSSVEVADSNAVEQSHMLNKTNDLTQEVFLSLENIENDVIDKIEFITASINKAQKGIEDISIIEKRIDKSKAMAEKSSQQMIKLREYSDEIVNLTDMINSISKEINMLSLNASIEAARAGEHGKGFSIVAMEVGKLAKETEASAARIEKVIFTLKDEITLITDSIGEEVEYMNENYSVIKDTSQEFHDIIATLNLGKDSLEDIKQVTGENNAVIEEITGNIEKVTSFSEDIASHMVETAGQVTEQYSRSQYLQDVVEKISASVYEMQQFAVGEAMEKRMLKAAYYLKEHVKKEYLGKNKDMSNIEIQEILEEIGMDALYITNSSGDVIYTNEKSGIGLNLYDMDRSFSVLREGKKEYIVTPIKIRPEDGKVFKFLTVVDEQKRLYEVGLSLETLLQEM